MATHSKEEAELMLEQFQMNPEAMKALFNRGHPGHAHHLRLWQSINKVLRHHDGLREPTSLQDMQDSMSREEFAHLSADQVEALPGIVRAEYDRLMPKAAKVEARPTGSSAALLNDSKADALAKARERHTAILNDPDLQKALVLTNHPKHREVKAEYMGLVDTLGQSGSAAPNEGA